MTYKSIIQILLILAIISTVCISIMKPKMHKPVMVYNSKFNVEHDDGMKIDEQNIAVLVQKADVNQNSQVEVQNEGGINFIEPKVEDIQSITFAKNETKSQNVAIENKKLQNLNNSKINSANTKINNDNTNIKTVPTKASNNNIKKTQTKVNSQGEQENQSPKIDLNKIVSNNQKIINTPSKTVSTPVNTDSVPATNKQITTLKPPVQTTTKQQTQEVKTPVQKEAQIISTPPKQITAKTENTPIVLTAAQEEIAWNKWRSNLNNQIMKDSKLPTMPNGIIFKYKFTVDKYGKVSNVQTSSTTPGYTPYAIQFIAPVIRSYQGRSILNFPQGSRRESTEVSGAWKISSNSKLSTPDDYHDIEKVK